jgi:hypothetical protein
MASRAVLAGSQEPLGVSKMPHEQGKDPLTASCATASSAASMAFLVVPVRPDAL